MTLTVYLVHPGASFSTHDVYTGMLAGLEAAGCTVHTYRLDEALTFYGSLTVAAEAGGIQWEQKPNIAGLAAQRAAWEIGLLQPDLVIAVSGHNLHAGVPRLCRRMGIPTAVYCTESPYFGEGEHGFARFYDVVFTNERRSVPSFQVACRDSVVQYLPHAYNPAVHHPGPAQDGYGADVFFVGSAFPERKHLLRGVDWTGIDLVTKGFLWGTEGPMVAEDTLPNEEAAIYYRSAAISLNHHRTTRIYGAGKHIARDEADSLGPRAYEISACGGFQLCDDSRAELQEVFQGTVPTYVHWASDDLEDKVRYYLARPDERARLAQAQREAVAPHTWEARAKHVLETLTAVPRRKVAA